MTTNNAINAPLPISGANGGTGVANTGSTITLGGNLVTSGANSLTFTTTGATNVTLPTSGTLATTSGSGSFSLLTSVTASNSSEIDFNALFSSSYDIYWFELFGVVPVSSSILYMHLGTGAGPTWITANYNWTSAAVRALDAAQSYASSSTASEIRLTSVDTGNGIAASTAGCSGSVVLVGMNGSSNALLGYYDLTLIEQNQTFISAVRGGFYQPAATFTSVRFLMSSGNISSGVFRAYGLKNS